MTAAGSFVQRVRSPRLPLPNPSLVTSRPSRSHDSHGSHDMVKHGSADNARHARHARHPDACLYVGTTTHTRLRPVRHSFTYSVYMGCVDVHALVNGHLDCWPLFSSRTPWALLSLLSRDHLIHGNQTNDLETRARDVVEGHTGTRPKGRIRLMTNLRVLGVEFNPVSFYFVSREHDDDDMEAIIAEVSNFPWFEQHAYVVTPMANSDDRTNDKTNDNTDLRAFHATGKAFHVSPFMPLNGLRYVWRVRPPGQRVTVYIQLTDVDGVIEPTRTYDAETMAKFFRASVDGSMREWTTLNLLRVQLSLPVHTLRVMGGILYEAARLFRKGVTFYPHPSGATSALSLAVEKVVGTFTTVVTYTRRLFGKQADTA